MVRRSGYQRQNTTVTNDTFNSEGQDLKLAAWIVAGTSINVTDNFFIDSPGDAVDAFRRWSHLRKLFLWRGLFFHRRAPRRDLYHQ